MQSLASDEHYFRTVICCDEMKNRTRLDIQLVQTINNRSTASNPARDNRSSKGTSKKGGAAREQQLRHGELLLLDSHSNAADRRSGEEGGCTHDEQQCLTVFCGPNELRANQCKHTHEAQVVVRRRDDFMHSVDPILRRIYKSSASIRGTTCTANASADASREESVDSADVSGRN